MRLSILIICIFELFLVRSVVMYRKWNKEASFSVLAHAQILRLLRHLCKYINWSCKQTHNSHYSQTQLFKVQFLNKQLRNTLACCVRFVWWFILSSHLAIFCVACGARDTKIARATLSADGKQFWRLPCVRAVHLSSLLLLSLSAGPAIKSGILCLRRARSRGRPLQPLWH